ncbi:DEAD/DEAH box helicase family protein [Yersinia kristensenii]|uniref:DEAD/DEAH box helicase family protein n=1 Tax=Yersinia kristensenii TaxID=28152 RepID=UPI001C60EE48|nr:DEAD/DEAH box helicase family protein [Yersinia kristensenii]MBW5811523.1 DEAD/DEAH box helicase family protein [Yersinia kristensenii]
MLKTDVDNHAGNLSTLALDAHYRTGERDPVSGFYKPCLDAAAYDRAVGYFRSSIFAIIGQHFLDFARRGGKARFICSPSITEDDARAIALGYIQREDLVELAISRDIDALLSDPAAMHRAKLLATFIKYGALDIKVAIRSGGNGIYHEKIGIFDDGQGHQVSFLGSANETWNAWHAEGNHESIEVFSSWLVADEVRVQSHRKIFDLLWKGKTPGIDTIDFPEAQHRRLLTVAAPSLDAPEIEPIQSASTTRRRLLPHQATAIDLWNKAGQRGVFEHATGSGKTFTAIEAIKNHLATGEPAIVLVPSQLLHEQWKREILEEITDASILMAGGGHIKWSTRGRLRSHTSPSLGMNRVVIATMQTASTDSFINGLSQGEHLLIVADEIHQIGSPKNSLALGIRSGASLGLSATPIRYGDPEGTQRIFDRFGPVIQPAITLQDAIAAGRLVNYEYFPHEVHLSDDESELWKKFTKQIRFELAKTQNKDGNARLTEKAKMLLIQRSRIAKKARAKTGLAAGVIKKEFHEGQSWLVYCEDSSQLDEMLSKLRDEGFTPLEYYSNMPGDKVEALNWFKRFGGILVSIKCLDEGIDIPAVSHAFILASSQNPRQFIQRRGRVLRKSPGKDLAVIHDAIVVPLDQESESEQISLLKAELIRALEFADSALNKGAGADLRRIALEMGIDSSCKDVAAIEDYLEEE